MAIAEYVVLAVAAIPFIYYLLVLLCAGEYFRTSQREARVPTDFTPGVSCLKPIKGLDEDAYENYASFCRQDYPEYEIVFCVDPGDPALPLVERLIREFPDRKIRVLLGSGRTAINDKVTRLVRLTNEASYDIFAITDGDVRVRPDYLRNVVAPFRDPDVGAATCLYVSAAERNLVQKLQSTAMLSDFYASVLVAWKLDGVKFCFGQTIVTTRKAVQGYGGYQTIENRPADDLYAGRLVAEQGYEVKLLPYVVQTTADFQSFSELLHKRVRWATVQRHMRPWGHIGLIFTFGLPWAIIAVASHPTVAVAAAYFGGYAAFRTAMTWTIGSWGMKQSGIWKKIALIPVWDALAVGLWLVSFGRSTIRWRNIEYHLRDGMMVPRKQSES
ncbi:MAG: glycosyltransferase [Candidatus Acidiferrales bacterium]